MRPFAAATALAAVVLVGGAAWMLGRPARADSAPAVLYVSGLHVDGSKPGTIVELANTSTAAGDFYALSYLLFHADGHRAANPVDLPPLTAGKHVTIDVGGAVAAYRNANGIAPFAGPVQMVIYGASCADLATCPAGVTPQPFGPAVIHVSASQVEGGATYDAAVQWHVTP